VDLIKEFNTFANTVADALNEQKVVPPNKEMGFAILLMVHPGKSSEEETNPVGGSLNYVKDRWVTDIELQYARPLGVDPS
jgi:hypothetical protein